MSNNLIQRSIKLLLCICLTSTFFMAQGQSWSDVLSVNLKNIAPIYENNNVKGYYMFYEVEKKDRKTRKYLLQFLDENMNVIAKKYITGTRTLELLEGHYNGQNLLLKFSDSKEKVITFRVYNTAAELVYKKTKSLDVKRNFTGGSKGAEVTAIGAGVIPVSNKGFANIELVRNKRMGYEVTYLQNEKGRKGWVYATDAKSKEFQTANFMGTTKDLILITVTKRPNGFSTETTNYLLGIDINSGKKRFEHKLEDKEYKVLFMNSYFDENTKKLTLMGLFFDRKNSVASNRSKGLCIYTVDETGTVNDKKYLGWTTEISKLLPVNHKGKIEDVGYMFFQNIFRTSDGRLFAVAEQYRKRMSGVGIAAKVLNRNNNISVTKIMIEDIMVLEFTKDNELRDVTFFDKSKSNLALPAGGALLNVQILGQLANYYGGYDYIFTQQHKDSDVFSFVFNDYDREKKNWTIKSVTYVDDAYSTDEMELSSDYEDFIVMQGKSGHVLLAEYNEKKKTLDMRLEKINY